MNFRYGISLLLLLLLVFLNCARIKKEPSHIAGAHESDGPDEFSTAIFSPPKDSIIQSYFSDEYSIHIYASLAGSEYLPLPEYMWLIIYNSNGRTIFPADGRWSMALKNGLVPLEPEWPDYFLVHEHNMGNCCICGGNYVLKVTADEIKFIGLVNGYKDGKFYVNICHWPPLQETGKMTLEKREVPLVNDTLHYPEDYNQ